MFSMSVFPLINQPTHITNQSHSIIDNIYTNSINEDIISGVIIPDNRWTTKLTFWQPRGHTRNKGRPKFRWRDDLDKFRKHWHRDTSDRLRWRQMGKAYVQLRTFKG